MREYTVMTTFYSLHALMSVTEETLRAVVRSPGSIFSIDAHEAFARLTDHVLWLTHLQHLKPLFLLLRLLRNTIHTNGLFDPKDGEPASVSYAGRTFDFNVGRPLECIGESDIAWIARDLVDAIHEIVSAPSVFAIAQCPRGRS